MERLRAFVETRAGVQENMVRAIALESSARAAEALEGRIRIAERASMAFAEQGLQQHEAVLRALGRRVAALSREDVPPPAPLRYAAALNYVFGADPAAWPDCQPIEIRRDGGFLTDLAQLPILPGGAAKLVACHIVEHTTETELSGELLPRWLDLLAPGGELVVTTRDGPAVAVRFSREADDFAAFRALMSAENDGLPLRSLYDDVTLRRVLSAAGFAHVAPGSAPDTGALCVVARREA